MLLNLSARLARAPTASTTMSNNNMTFTNDVICYKELIDKEDTGRREWKAKYGEMFKNDGGGWRPVEPFEKAAASDSKSELRLACPFQQSAIQPSTLIRLETMVLLVALRCASEESGTLSPRRLREWTRQAAAPSRKDLTTATARLATSKPPFTSRKHCPCTLSPPPPSVPLP